MFRFDRVLLPNPYIFVDSNSYMVGNVIFPDI